MGTKEDESNTGRIWANGFHLVMAHSRLARILKVTTILFLNFQIFISHTVGPTDLHPSPAPHYLLHNA
jgi:energy-converting hydrogenase Eha subunit F